MSTPTSIARRHVAEGSTEQKAAQQAILAQRCGLRPMVAACETVLEFMFKIVPVHFGPWQGR
ncbi:hypothetical protein D9T14_05515 [Propionibacterium australiense]|uniref:Uncharacterized protein n=1 Tax=Propionibacterium australiense TaxID=119981 RepID=A0A8B3FKC0_9ACTN|nr:hypothetical protein D9T14_05515 [Propionibacterium australiense]RLP11286.1 hypothetical protein D7U36_03955 [Propionibacterium australiense]